MKLNKYLFKKISLSFFFFVISSVVSIAFGQSKTSAGGISEGYLNFIVLLFVALIVLVFALLFIFGMKKNQVEEDVVVKIAKEKSKFIKKIKQKLALSTSIESETNIISDQKYEGNRKMNKKIPIWFKSVLIGTIIFVIVYFFYYEIFNSGSSHMQGGNMMNRTAVIQKEEPLKAGNVLNENTVAVLTDKPSLEKGKIIFNTNCAACHRADAGGLVGPNLTDDYWINGGGIKNIVKTITNGVPEKGMISWKAQLNPKQIQETASYIISLHGTDPANPKPTQGEKYTGK